MILIPFAYDVPPIVSKVLQILLSVILRIFLFRINNIILFVIALSIYKKKMRKETHFYNFVKEF